MSAQSAQGQTPNADYPNNARITPDATQTGEPGSGQLDESPSQQPTPPSSSLNPDYTTAAQRNPDATFAGLRDTLQVDMRQTPIGNVMGGPDEDAEPMIEIETRRPIGK